MSTNYLEKYNTEEKIISLIQETTRNKNTLLYFLTLEILKKNNLTFLKAIEKEVGKYSFLTLIFDTIESTHSTEPLFYYINSEKVFSYIHNLKYQAFHNLYGDNTTKKYSQIFNEQQLNKLIGKFASKGFTQAFSTLINEVDNPIFFYNKKHIFETLFTTKFAKGIRHYLQIIETKKLTNSFLASLFFIDKNTKNQPFIQFALSINKFTRDNPYEIDFFTNYLNKAIKTNTIDNLLIDCLLATSVINLNFDFAAKIISSTNKTNQQFNKKIYLAQNNHYYYLKEETLHSYLKSSLISNPYDFKITLFENFTDINLTYLKSYKDEHWNNHCASLICLILENKLQKFLLENPSNINKIFTYLNGFKDLELQSPEQDNFYSFYINKLNLINLYHFSNFVSTYQPDILNMPCNKIHIGEHITNELTKKSLSTLHHSITHDAIQLLIKNIEKVRFNFELTKKLNKKAPISVSATKNKNKI